MKPSLIKIILIVAFSLFLCVSISAQDTLQKGIELYKSGDYENSVNILEKTNKNDKDAYLSFYYLGLSYERQNKFKNALKVYKTSVSLNSAFAPSKTGLAYIYLKFDKLKDAIKMAEESVLIDPKDYKANYILGSAYYLLDKKELANKYFDKVIEIKPDFAEVYLMKYQAFVYPSENIKDNRKRSIIYKEKFELLNKYISLSENSPKKEFWEMQRDSLEFFVKYYEQSEIEEGKLDEEEDKDTTGFKVLKKPLPSYTKEASRAGIKGFVRVLIAFESDGKIQHILLINSLGYGLDEAVIKKAKEIQFIPPTENGQPKTIVKVLQYSFWFF